MTMEKNKKKYIDLGKALGIHALYNYSFIVYLLLVLYLGMLPLIPCSI